MLKKEHTLNPSMIDACKIFLQKNKDKEIIRLSYSDRDILFPSYFGINETIKILEDLRILEECENDAEYRLVDSSYHQNINLKQIIAFNFIRERMPSWIVRFRKGIDGLKEIKEIDFNTYQSLHELGIFKKNLSEEAKNFMYLVRNVLLEKKTFNPEKIETGKVGEYLSCAYEHKKTGKEPQQKSLYDNDAGFDIISYYPDNQIKRIEVKATRYNTFYISWNEWKVALESIKNNIQFEFHFWRLANNLCELAIIKPHALTNIIGDVEYEKGSHWLEFKIIFEDIKDRFFQTNLKIPKNSYQKLIIH